MESPRAALQSSPAALPCLGRPAPRFYTSIFDTIWFGGVVGRNREWPWDDDDGCGGEDEGGVRSRVIRVVNR